ncbi:hypothetical protein WDU94_003342 [Cyamophila willieti]
MSSVPKCSPMNRIAEKGLLPRSRSRASRKSKSKKRKVTNQMIEEELEALATCFENKRQLRLAAIPAEVAECVKVERCCKPRPDCVDVFYDRFERELSRDDRIRRRIKSKSACRKIDQT